MSDSLVTIMRKLISRPVQANVTEVIDQPNPSVNLYITHRDYIVILGTGATALRDCTFELGVEI